MSPTRFDRLKAKLAGKLPIVEEAGPVKRVEDWQAVMAALHKRLYTGWKAPKIDLIRSGKFKDG